jgi:cbb3-type cytochrome oxidase subunit 3
VKTSESSRIRVWASITLMIGVYVGAVYWVYRASSGASESMARLLPLATAWRSFPWFS